MPLIERTKESMREEFVKRALGYEKSKSALCKEYNISRPTGDDWIRRYRAGESLADKSRAPHKPNKTSENIELLIVQKRLEYPEMGATKMRRHLEDEGYKDLPCAKTFNNIFKRNNLITKEASAAATPNIRYEKEYPNEMWHFDYKGHFGLGNKERCHPLTVTDDYSRKCIMLNACRTETLDELKPLLIEAFQEYGMPFSILCDNGNPWGTSQSTGFSRFEVWLMELGILTTHTRFQTPKTNGKNERFNGCLNRECIKNTPKYSFADFDEAQQSFDRYKDYYNNIRPHHSLGLDTPEEHYQKSHNKYQDRISEWEYSSEYEIRKVKETGFFNFANQGYFLSEAFAGKEIAIRESHKKDCITLYFRQFKIARINVDKRVYEYKKAYLIEGDPRKNFYQNV